jgi:hypothetical protein
MFHESTKNKFKKKKEKIFYFSSFLNEKAEKIILALSTVNVDEKKTGSGSPS